MSSTGPGAEAARADFRELMEAKGHAVDNARAGRRAAGVGLRGRRPGADADARPVPADLMQALEQDEGQKLGGKSAEAARVHPPGDRPRADNA